MRQSTWLVQLRIGDEHLLQLLGQKLVADSPPEIARLVGGSETDWGGSGVRRRYWEAPSYMNFDRCSQFDQ